MNNSKWSSTNQLPCPTAADLLKLTRNGIDGVANVLQSTVEVNELDDFGQLSFELVMLLLEQISSRMSSGQTLRDYLCGGKVDE